MIPKKKKLLVTVATAAILLNSVSAFAAQCTNDTWNQIREEGKIVIGVKPD